MKSYPDNPESSSNLHKKFLLSRYSYRYQDVSILVDTVGSPTNIYHDEVPFQRGAVVYVVPNTRVY